jgi:hypothetical protein
MEALTMDDSRSGSQARRLRAVGDGAAPDTAALEAAISVCVAVTPGGILVRSLADAVADELGVARAAVSHGALQVALGLMIATGRVDEVGGRLVAVGQEQRRAG